MITIGYWRPVNHHTLDLLTEPDYREVDRYRADANKDRRGEHTSQYVSAAQHARYGTTTKAEYFEGAANRARLVADEEFALPAPVAGQLTEADAEILGKWLDGGREATNYCGTSRCRICKRVNGSAELARAGYQYPEGLGHYVTEHLCAVPGLPDAVWRETDTMSDDMKERGYSRLTDQRTRGWLQWHVIVYRQGDKLRITGIPDDREGVHNCDASGCRQEHVIAQARIVDGDPMPDVDESRAETEKP